MATENRITRDLRWALQSESLIKSDGAIWPDSNWFHSLETGIQPDSDAPVPKRLGLWFERLIQDWILQDPGRQLLAHNLQVRESQRTLGEFDMLVQSNDQVEHWELAVKFYLGTGNQSDAGKWYGPNPEDSLATKIERMVSHQLRLAEAPAARTLLAAMNIHNVLPRGIVKGRLFYPIEQFGKQPLEFPDTINPAHEKGWWLSMADFLQEDMFGPQYRYHILPKALWLSRLCIEDRLKGLARSSCLEQFRNESTPDTVHLAILDQAGNEVSRGFLVSEEWLARTSV